MNLFSTSFTFYKAGQGAFYGGFIKQLSVDNYYSLVYDCGTSPYIIGHTQSLMDEISSFKATLFSLRKDYKPKLDFLFISHLDYDHVSGLKILLKEFNVKNIILPYIDPLIRSLLFITYEEEDGGDENLFTSDEYGRLLINPVQFLNSFEGQPIIFFVKGGRGDNSDDNLGDNNLLDGEINYSGSSGTVEEIEVKPNVKVFNNLMFRIQRKWDFITHVEEVEKEVIDAIRIDIYKILKLGINDNLAADKLSDLFKNDKNRKELRECYKRHLIDLNGHGLVLLHGPKNFHNIYVCDSKCRCNCPFGYYYCCEGVKLKNKSLYTLLLGDTSLNLNNNPLNFPKPLLEELKYVHVVQLPHHGSSKNWNYQKYKVLKLGTGLNDSLELTSVCNYGVGNTYNHPSQDVIHEIDNKLILNNQYTRFTTNYCFIEFND